MSITIWGIGDVDGPDNLDPEVGRLIELIDALDDEIDAESAAIEADPELLARILNTDDSEQQDLPRPTKEDIET